MSYDRYQRGGFISSLLLWFTIIFLLSGVGFFLLDIMGVYSLRPHIAPYLEWTGFSKTIDPYSQTDPLLLERERIEKRELAVQLQQQEIVKTELVLARRHLELEEMANELTEQQRNQQERETQFVEQYERYDNENANLRQNAEYLLAMSPQNAVARLSDMDDVVLIAHLRMAEQITTEANQASMVPVWLSLMPAEQSARVLKKMQLPLS